MGDVSDEIHGWWKHSFTSCQTNKKWLREPPTIDEAYHVIHLPTQLSQLGARDTCRSLLLVVVRTILSPPVIGWQALVGTARTRLW